MIKYANGGMQKKFRHLSKGRIILHKYRAVILLIWSTCIIVFFLIVQYDYEYQYQALHSGESVSAEGTLISKIPKQNTIIYYLKNVRYQTTQSSRSCQQILVRYPKDRFQIGSHIRFSGKVRLAEFPRNEGEFNQKKYFKSQRILFSLDAVTATVLELPTFYMSEKTEQCRRRIQKFFLQELSSHHSGILTAMITGDKSGLTRESKIDYQIHGLSHILAISGLHISIVGLLLYRCMRRFGISYLTSGITAFIIVALFVLFSGNAVSSVRAFLMFIIFLIANLFGAPYHMFYSLLYTVLIILTWNPLIVFYSGFVLSVFAILSICFFCPIFSIRLQRLKNHKRISNVLNKMLAQISITLGVFFGMLPITAYYFFQISISGLIFNTLFLPWVGMVLLFAILAGLFCLFLPLPGRYCLSVSQKLLSIFDFGMQSWDSIGGNTLITGMPSVLLVVICYTGMVGTVLVSVRKKIKVVLLIGIVLGLLLFPKKQYDQIVFLDVGSGRAVCISTSDGASVFLDGCSSQKSDVGHNQILPFLKSKGIKEMDTWICSRNQIEEKDVILSVLEEHYPIRALLLPEQIRRDKEFYRLLRIAEERNIVVRYSKTGSEISFANGNMRCISEESIRAWNLKLRGYTIIFAETIHQIELLKSQDQRADLIHLQEMPERISDVWKEKHVIVSEKKKKYKDKENRETADRRKGCDTIYETKKSGQISIRISESGQAMLRTMYGSVS